MTVLECWMICKYFTLSCSKSNICYKKQNKTKIKWINWFSNDTSVSSILKDMEWKVLIYFYIKKFYLYISQFFEILKTLFPRNNLKGVANIPQNNSKYPLLILIDKIFRKIIEWLHTFSKVIAYWAHFLGYFFRC